MKRTTLTAHIASDGHNVAVEHERNRTARPGTSIAEQSIQKMNRAAFDKLDKLFRNAHAIAKNNRPFSDYVWMATLEERTSFTHISELIVCHCGFSCHV